MGQHEAADVGDGFTAEVQLAKGGYGFAAPGRAEPAHSTLGSMPLVRAEWWPFRVGRLNSEAVSP
jgi:hypothetical protein